MTKFKFGDMVCGSTIGYGCFMVVAPYFGDRGVNDDEGPAVWIVDIDTEYVRAGLGGAGVVWVAEHQLEPLDE